MPKLDRQQSRSLVHQGYVSRRSRFVCGAIAILVVIVAIVVVLPIVGTAGGGSGGGGGGDDGDEEETEVSPTISPLSMIASAEVIPVEEVEAEVDEADAVFAARGFDISSRASYKDTGTDYTEAPQRFRVYHPALESISTVDMILCFITNMGVSNHVNEPEYMVLTQMSKCQAGGGESKNNGAPDFMKFLVNSTRETADSPQEVHCAIPQGVQTIYVRVTIYEEPSDERPFGAFHMSYRFANTTLHQTGGGELRTVETNQGTALTFLEENTDWDSVRRQRSASIIRTDDSGYALVTKNRMDQPEASDTAFALRFEDDLVLVQQANNVTNLAYQFGAVTNGTCFNRTDTRHAIWSYRLFNAATGASVPFKTGFPFMYGSARGYYSYWGIWMEGDVALPDGSAVTRQGREDDPLTGRAYTVMKARGKLIKKTVSPRNLTDIPARAQFSYWDGTTSYLSFNFDEWILQYLTAASAAQQGIDGVTDTGFYKTGMRKWSNNGGPEEKYMKDLAANATRVADPSVGSMLWLYSNQFGGQVTWRGGDDFVVTFSEAVVSPDDALFQSSDDPVQLYCMSRCVFGTITAGNLTNWNDPFLSDPATVSVAPEYNISRTNMVLNRDGNDIVTDPTLSLESAPNHQWGIDTGPLVPRSDRDAAVASMNSNPNGIASLRASMVYYEWRFGDRDWTQASWMVDTVNDTVATVDAPMRFPYVHSAARDRDGLEELDGDYFTLEYNGDSIHGIPSIQVDTDNDGSVDRWYPRATLRDGVLLGASNQYVVKAIEGELLMQGTSGTCGNLTMTAPPLDPPTSLNATHDPLNFGWPLNDIATPKYIDGVLQ